MENNTKVQEQNIATIWEQRPLIISGPCSAETEEQVLQGARDLAATGKVNIFRAGIWKPRTKPGMFEGVGATGLPWLQKAKEQTGLPIAVEVATAGQVALALAHEVDILWIGARTTVNPFSVQEIADALRGVNVPVMIKNPINADIELWSGAMERISRANISKIGLIHRGFSSYGNTQYRNAPMWHLAIDMKLRYPDALMINDPSHICGRRDTLQAVMQKAADLDYDGLMIESHIDPDKAWSDAAQQITAGRLKEILEEIQWRKEDANSASYRTALEAIRQKINQLDDELLQLLSQRMQLAEEIARYKKENNITILQSGRWSEVLDNAIKTGAKKGLSKDFITRYFDAIHIESINHQKKIMDSRD